MKFWLTLAATLAANFALTARLHEAARAAARYPDAPISRMDLGFMPYNLVIISCVGLTVYTTNVVLSVVKPWGVRANTPSTRTPFFTSVRRHRHGGRPGATTPNNPGDPRERGE